MKQLLALSLAVAVGLAGCVSDDESTTPVPPAGATFKALFVPLGGIFPFPNDLFFSGSADGTVNIPVSDPNDVSDYLVAINALDGYSTTAPIVVPFNGAIDPASITAASVRVINITNPMAPVPLGFGTAFTAAVSPAVDGTTQLMITPVAPLNAKARYMVLVTIGVTGGSVGAVPDDTMQILLDCHGELAVPDCTPPPQLAAVWGAINGLFDLANAFGVTDASIAVVASFATQSTLDVMTFVNTNAVAGATPPGATLVGTTGTLIGGASPNLANVYQTVFSVPYYQSQAAATTGHWFTGTGAEVTRYTVGGGAGPAATATLNIPILISTPKTAKPGPGWPTIIFQHGITGDRTNMLGLADAAAAAGFAVVAIDQPLHGLGTTHPLRIAGAERTFDLDVSNNVTRAPGADGIVDLSGQNYINLSSLLTSRDNLRQSAADLIRLAKSIAAIDYDGGGGLDLDASRVHFVGHSLGAIVGTTFLGVNTDVQAATLGMPGGTIARLLRDSPTFSVSINNGLASNGVIAGTQLYEQFMQAAQTVVDSGDPINFAAVANTNHAIHMIQVVGTSVATQDQVVPNSATARLIAAMGLAKRSAVGANGPDGYVNFTAGNHSSLLSPAGSAAAFSEMQTQMANFMGSNGAAIVITNAAVIEP